MHSVQLQGTYVDLTTPHVADACLRLGIPVRCAPVGTRPLWSGTHLVGRVCPARHYGSVDVFLEAIEGSNPGDVLVVDNGGRPDEACVGDLVTLEASRAGLSGIVIWAGAPDSARWICSEGYEKKRRVQRARCRQHSQRPGQTYSDHPAPLRKWTSARGRGRNKDQSHGGVQKDEVAACRLGDAARPHRGSTTH